METVFICPTDFSECSLNALEFASRLGESYQAKLVILHVLNRKDYLKLSPMDTDGKYQVEFIQEKLFNLQVAVEKESLPKGLKSCEIMIVEGDIFEGIEDASERLGADMIIMGTEGMNDRKDLVLGSRASRMVEKSKVDVMIIPRTVFFKPFQKLVYASDYLEEDKADALRCFSLISGEELWQRKYSVHVKRNHGMSRTVPAINDKYVVTMGPKGHVMCSDP